MCVHVQYVFFVYDSSALKMGTTPAAAKCARYDTNYQRRLICLTETDQEMMVTLSAHEIILKYITERYGYGDGNLSEINIHLGNVTHKTLKHLVQKMLPTNCQCHNV